MSGSSGRGSGSNVHTGWCAESVDESIEIWDEEAKEGLRIGFLAVLFMLGLARFQCLNIMYSRFILNNSMESSRKHAKNHNAMEPTLTETYRADKRDNDVQQFHIIAPKRCKTCSSRVTHQPRIPAN